jgi:hypothetical protein
MQQRQPRLGDILDDYCPRERRLTNHVVVAMVGSEVKQTRCSTCDADHPYKHARVPKPRRKTEPAALYAQALAVAPKRVAHGATPSPEPEPDVMDEVPASDPQPLAGPTSSNQHEPVRAASTEEGDRPVQSDEGPVHRTLIRAQFPRGEGQPPPARPGPDFTIRQPAGRQNRFRPRQSRAGQGFQGNRSNGNVAGGSGRSGSRPFSGRSPMMSHQPRHHGPGGKRSK